MTGIKHPYLISALKFLFTGIALYVVFNNVPIKELLHLFNYIHYAWLLPAVLFFIASKIISSFRLYLLFQYEQLPVNKSYNQKLYLLGMFYNFFLPGGIGGDGYKIYKITKEFTYPVLKVSKIILSDRISGLIALCNLAALLFISMSSITERWLMILATVFCNTVFYLLIRKKIALPTFYFKTEFLSWMVQLAQCICAFFILKSLSVNDHVFIYLFIFLLSSVASLFPLSIGGLGAREFTFLWAASLYPIDKEKAICIGLLFYCISLFTSSFGGYFLFKPISKQTSYARI